MTRRMRIGWAAGLFCLFLQAGLAEETAVTADARAVERQAFEKTLADLNLRMDEGRKALIEVRRSMEALALAFSTENEQAQKLTAEMNELRKALREKDTELRGLLQASPEFTDLAAREKSLADELMDLQKKYEENAAQLKALQEEVAAPAPETPKP